jgi:hypothetical protein
MLDVHLLPWLAMMYILLSISLAYILPLTNYFFPGYVTLIVKNYINFSGCVLGFNGRTSRRNYTFCMGICVHSATLWGVPRRPSASNHCWRSLSSLRVHPLPFVRHCHHHRQPSHETNWRQTREYQSIYLLLCLGAFYVTQTSFNHSEVLLVEEDLRRHFFYRCM